MAVSDIQHSELPDNLLHEPKGASTATANSVYFANGSGSGSFRKIQLPDVEFTRSSVNNLTNQITNVIENTDVIENINNVITIDGLGLTKITDGTMEDVPYSAEVPISFTDNLNKNFAELFALYNNLVTIHNSIKKNINEATKKINETLTALKESGVINNV